MTKTVSTFDPAKAEERVAAIRSHHSEVLRAAEARKQAAQPVIDAAQAEVDAARAAIVAFDAARGRRELVNAWRAAHARLKAAERLRLPVESR